MFQQKLIVFPKKNSARQIQQMPVCSNNRLPRGSPNVSFPTLTQLAFLMVTILRTVNSNSRFEQIAPCSDTAPRSQVSTNSRGTAQLTPSPNRPPSYTLDNLLIPTLSQIYTHEGRFNTKLRISKTRILNSRAVIRREEMPSEYHSQRHWCITQSETRLISTEIARLVGMAEYYALEWQGQLLVVHLTFKHLQTNLPSR